MNFRRRAIVLSLAAVGLISKPVAANTLQLSQEGAGEVLIYPYYTVRNGTISLLSLVNGTDQGKAARLRVREAIGGRTVAELNVFLSAKDVWTAAIAPTADGATIVSNDKSCTNPKISGSSAGLVFSSAGFANDGAAYAAYTPADRTREGYVELLEMATVPNATALGKDITHVAGVPSCKLTGDASSPTIQSTLAAPSGELFGGMSFINLNDGIGISYNASAINGFWRTGPGAPTPTITAPVQPSAANPASAPDLTSGGNTTITVTDEGKTYISTFARSIDAVSALFMASSIRGEYGFTTDGVFSNAFVVTLPTKAYYVYSSTLSLYQRTFSSTTVNACDDGAIGSVDREEFIDAGPDGFPEPPPNTPSPLSWCESVNVFGPADPSPFVRSAATAFESPRSRAIRLIQNQGMPAPLGKEGGHLKLDVTYPSSKLIPTSSSVLSRSATTGELAWTPVAHTYYGLPMLGFALSVAKYNAGTPQQNFGNMNPLNTQRTITAP